MKKCPICKERPRNKSYCKECAKKYHKKWYQKHKVQEQKKALIYSRKYRKENKEKCKEYRKKLLEKNPSYNRLQVKKWREKNRERVKKYNRKYREFNKEKERVRGYAYIHLRDKMIRKIGRCQKCLSKEDLQLHHLEYNNNPKSLMLLCRSCHKKEHDGKTV